jgi:L-amino acid N-acyltransferase YncA
VTYAAGKMRARHATVTDVPAITTIYNQGIADRVATYETEPRTEGMVRGWLDTPYPVIVVECGGRDIAFASTAAYRPRACYAGIAEFSVYVERDSRGHGAGRVAMTALIQAASDAGLWKLVSRVFVENTASRRLLRSLGFREVGVYQRHAQLDGVWRDVVIVERLLGPALVGPVHGLWQSDAASVAAWPELSPGTAITILKRKPDGSDGPRYPGLLMETTMPAPWIEARAFWTHGQYDIHGLVFENSDEVREFFSPLHPFNAFALYAADGAFKGWYANVTHPTLLDTSGDTPCVIWPDLILDLVMLPHGTLIELDDDELAASGLPGTNPELSAQIIETREHLRGLLRQGFFPVNR